MKLNYETLRKLVLEEYKRDTTGILESPEVLQEKSILKKMLFLNPHLHILHQKHLQS